MVDARIVALRRRVPAELFATALVFIVAAVIPMVLGFDSNYDQRNYHVLSGLRVLHGTAFEPLDLGHGSLNNPIVNIPYVLAVSHFPPRLVSWLFAMMAATVVFPLLAILRLVLPGSERQVQLYRGAAVLVGLSGPMWLSELGTSFTDATLLPVATGALYAYLRGLRVKNDRLVFIGFFVMGATAGLKTTFAPFAVALFVALIFAGQFRGRKWLALSGSALATVLGFLLTGGWWTWLLWNQFRNPVFPYFNRFFRSPDFTATNWWDSRFDQRSVFRLATLPLRLVVGTARVAEAPVRDPRWALVLVGFGLIAASHRGRSNVKKIFSQKGVSPQLTTLGLEPITTCALGIYMVTGYVIWAWQFGIARYALPIDVLSGAAFLIPALVLFSNRRPKVWWAVVLFVVIAGSRPPRWGNVPFASSPYRSIASLTSLPADSFLVLGNTEPSAYLAFSAPSSVRLVRTGFLFPDGSPRMNSLVAETLKAARGSGVWLVGLPDDGDWLVSIGLREDSRNCTPVLEAFASGVSLCPWVPNTR